MKLRLLTLAAGIAAFASPAFAADPILYDPAPVPAGPTEWPAAFDWTGAYVGVQGGYAWTRLSPAGASDEDFDGGTAGAYAGFNFQHDNFVFGIEGDVNYSWNERSFAVPGLGTTDVGTDWDGSVRGRLGYAFDRTMVYGTGGIAFARGFVDPVGLSKETETFTGWTVGGGVEHAFTDNLIARAEYRYSDFGRKDFGLAGANFDLHQHAVRVGLGYKF